MSFLDDIPDLDLGPKRGPNKNRRPAVKRVQVVYYIKVACPVCHSERCPVYNTRDIPIRHHRCKKCGHTFKSVEIKVLPAGLAYKIQNK